MLLVERLPMRNSNTAGAPGAGNGAGLMKR